MTYFNQNNKNVRLYPKIPCVNVHFSKDKEDISVHVRLHIRWR